MRPEAESGRFRFRSEKVPHPEGVWGLEMVTAPAPQSSRGICTTLSDTRCDSRGWSCTGLGAGLNDPGGSLPTQRILRFYAIWQNPQDKE